MIAECEGADCFFTRVVNGCLNWLRDVEYREVLRLRPFQS